MGHIYWIASYPKSGNTWMRAFLAQLVGETDEDRDLNRLREFAPDECHAQLYTPLLGKPIETASMAELAAVRPRVHTAIADAVVGFQFLKTHAMLCRHAGTQTITPAATAGALYIVRNPLDVVVSYSHFRKFEIDASIRVLNERGHILPRHPKHSYVPCGSWSEHVLSWTAKPHERLLVVRYEDMLAAPDATFDGISSFLHMDVAPERLAVAIANTDFEQLRATEQQHGFAEKPKVTEAFFRAGTAEQWRSQLTDSQVAAVVVPNRAAMQKMGYWLPEFDEI